MREDFAIDCMYVLCQGHLTLCYHDIMLSSSYMGASGTVTLVVDTQLRQQVTLSVGG